MQSQDNARLREILDQAADLAPDQRGAFLDSACFGDSELRKEVESLLGHLENENGLLSDVTAVAAVLRADRPPGVGAPSAAEGPGSRIGRYKLLQLIGEGGFGTVFMAEQEHPVRRRVALKIIKLGMDSKQVIARFEAERQALAMMDHPNIARVLDGGTTDTGRPYFVMDLVKGVPITEYCDSQNLPARLRLELFAQVCQAVQHAHQKGIIHRDIKPNNVLVTLADGTPIPKIIDFGIAKATNARLTEQTYFTEFRQFIGTPQYMSPEQAEMSAIDIDTRSDIYSLGVLLYELLTGTTPLDAKSLRSAAYDQVRQMIREVQPPRPSTRLSTLGETAGTVAKQRSTEPQKLGQLLRGELDWIVMKALEKDRTRRYETANGLAADVHRHLNNEPVMARPPSRMYALQKFVSRHWVGAMAGSAVATALVIGLALATYGLVRARAEKRIADQQKQLAIENGKRADDNARTSEANAKAADANAKAAAKNEHEAQVRLAEGWIAQADALSTSGKFDEAHPLYVAAYEKLRDLHEPLTAAEIALWSSYRQRATPILTYRGHSAPVNSVALAPDGRTALSASDDKSIKMWDLPTGREIRSLVGHGGPVNCIAVAPDGRRAISGSSDGTLKLWDLRSGSEIRTFTGHASDVLAVAITPDGKAALSGSKDGTLKLWNMESGTEQRTFRGHAMGVMCVAVAPDGQTALSGSADGTLRLWDLTNGKAMRTLDGRGGVVLCVAVSPDGRTALAGSADKTLTVWKLDTGKISHTLVGHARGVTGVAFSSDGQTAVSASVDGSLKLWDPLRGTELRAFRGHNGAVTSVATSPGAKIALSGGADHTLNLWNLAADDALTTLNGHTGPVEFVAISPDGRTALSTSDDKTVRLWALATGRQLRTLEGHTARVYSANFSPDGRFALSGGEDTVMRLWNLSSGEMVQSFKGHTGAINSVAFSPNGQTALSAGTDSTLRLWDISSGRQLRTFSGNGSEFVDVVYAPDGRTALSTSYDNTLELWDIDNGKEIRTLIGHTKGVNSVAITSDGQTAVSASNDATLKVWDLSSSKERRTLIGHTGEVGWVAIFPDGRTALSSGMDQMLRLWDLSSGKQLRTLTGHEGSAGCVAISRDGQCALSGGGSDRTIKLWNFAHGPAQLDLESQVASAQERLRRSPEDPASLATIGEWFAFRGMSQWATPLLVRARQGGAPVSPLLLAGCYVKSNDLAQARRGYQEVMEQDNDASERRYVALCMADLDKASEFHQSEETSATAEKWRKLADQEIAAGRTQDATAHLAAALARDPDDSILLCQVEMLQAWFGEDAELEATARAAIAHAKSTSNPSTADRTAQSALMRPCSDKELLESALVLARRAVELGKSDADLFPYYQMTLGRAEYRCGHYEAADDWLRAAIRSAVANGLGSGDASAIIVGSTFFRAMSLFRQGKEAEARALATDAASRMAPLPLDEKNPPVGTQSLGDLVSWMAYKEAKAMFETGSSDGIGQK